MALIFGRCYHSMAVVMDVKYNCDSTQRFQQMHIINSLRLGDPYMRQSTKVITGSGNGLSTPLPEPMINHYHLDSKEKL